jgi:hypothetical protein
VINTDTLPMSKAQENASVAATKRITVVHDFAIGYARRNRGRHQCPIDSFEPFWGCARRTMIWRFPRLGYYRQVR